jgi:hypothetical protein
MNATRIIALGLLGTAGLGFLPGPQQAGAQITAQGGGHLLRLRFTRGATINYSTTTTFQMPGAKGAPGSMTMPLSIRVTDVRNDVATLTVTTTAPQLPGAKGKAQQQTQTMRMDRRGRPVGQPVMGLEGLSHGYPQGPVRIGQTWTDTMTMPGPGGQMSLRSTYRLVSVQGGFANINVALSGSAQGGGAKGKGAMTMRISGTGTMRVDVRDGWAQSSRMNMTMNMTMNGGTGQQAQTVTMTTTTTRR